MIGLLDRIGNRHGRSGTLIERGAVHRIVHDLLRYKRTSAIVNEYIFCIAPDLYETCQCGFGARSAADNDLPNLIDTVFAAERSNLFERFETRYHNDLVHTAAGVQRGKRSCKHRLSGEIHKELVLAHPRRSSGCNDNNAAGGVFGSAKKIRKATHRFNTLRLFGLRRH